MGQEVAEELFGLLWVSHGLKRRQAKAKRTSRGEKTISRTPGETTRVGCLHDYGILVSVLLSDQRFGRQTSHRGPGLGWMTASSAVRDIASAATDGTHCQIRVGTYSQYQQQPRKQSQHEQLGFGDRRNLR